MLLLFTLILSVVLLARFFEERLRLPFALGAIVLAYLLNQWFHLEAFNQYFPEIVYLMLPIILIPDLLGVSRTELRHNLGAIFYLSVIAVLASIALAIGLTTWLAPQYQLTLGIMLALFVPLMATDVVSVSSIFNRFRLPERLKLYAEGESLFNDITAMIIFFFIALPLISGGEFKAEELYLILGTTFIESLLIGLLAGSLGYYAFKFFRDSVEQFLTLYLMASLAFLLGEHFEVSGILGVVVAVLLFKYLFDKEGQYQHINATVLQHFLNSESTTEFSFRAYRKEAHYLGFFANGVIFIAIASMVDLQLLWHYRDEILAVFIGTTLIRMLVIAPLIIRQRLPFRWVGALTFAGMKGGLAIIMAFAIPDNFVYKEAFMAIIVGVVILSMFINTALLVPLLHFYGAGFLLDKADGNNHASNKQAKAMLKHLLNRDHKTHAYNQWVFEDLIEKEIARAQRHQTSFALLAFEVDSSQVVVDKLLPILRKSDSLGRLSAHRFALLLPHSDISAALKLAYKLRKQLGGLHIAVSEYTTGDTLEMICEKLEIALKSQKPIDIEI